MTWADSYHDANRIAEVNGFNHIANGACGLNGSILYVVQSDEDKVSSIAGVFAGEE